MGLQHRSVNRLIYSVDLKNEKQNEVKSLGYNIMDEKLLLNLGTKFPRCEFMISRIKLQNSYGNVPYISDSVGRLRPGKMVRIKMSGCYKTV